MQTLEEKQDVPFRAVTPKMLVAEKYVDRYIEKFKVPPTYREVAKDLGLSSVNSAFVRLRRYRHKMKQMEKKWVWTSDLIMEYAKHFYRSNGKSSIEKWKENYIKINSGGRK
jgi:hypothetical protein